MRTLPGLNYDSKLSVDDLAFSADETEKAILERFAISFGTGTLVNASFGIIDAADPRNVISTDTTRPLVVYVSTTNPLRINITPGTAVTPNGAIVINPVLVEDFELIRTAENDIIVIFLENEIIDSPPIRVTRYNVSQPVRRTQNTEIIRSALFSDFTNPVLFPPYRLNNIASIAVGKVINTTSGLELQIDLSDSSYTFNRPWFSIVDVQHRSKIGSGQVTDSNPHGLTFSDLVSGSLTIYDQMLMYGQFLAKDMDVKGVPGTICKESISLARVVTDLSGGVTARSRFGGSGAKYIMLAKYPAWITAFYWQTNKGRAVSWDWIPGTRIVVLPDGMTQASYIEYTEVTAAEPPAALLSNTLTLNQPTASRELAISGGLSLSDFSNPSIDFDGSGPVPRDFTVFLKPDGTLLRTPEIVGTPIILDDIGTTIHAIDYSFFGPTRISIGLAEANYVPTLSISIIIYGKDSSNSSVNETVSFSGTTWVPVPLPGVETAAQYVTTTNIYASLTSIQVSTRVDDGPASRIMIFGELETGTTIELNKLAMTTKISWDGLSIGNLTDLRSLRINLPTQQHRYLASASLLGLGGSSPSFILSEDLAQPKYLNTTKGYQSAVSASCYFVVNDYTTIVNGDLITFPNGKTLTALTSGVPNRSTGQFLAAITDQATRDEMVATINYSGFSSGYAAVANGTIGKQLDITCNTTGSRGNGVITTVLVNPGSISIGPTSALAGGIDAYGETYLIRQYDYIDTAIPSPTLYDVTSIRGRYISIPIPIASRSELRVDLYGVVPPQTNVQLRVRASLGTDVEWLPWVVVTSTGASFQILNTLWGTDLIKKVQLEIFGKTTGFSLYEVA